MLHRNNRKYFTKAVLVCKLVLAHSKIEQPTNYSFTNDIYKH